MALIAAHKAGDWVILVVTDSVATGYIISVPLPPPSPYPRPRLSEPHDFRTRDVKYHEVYGLINYCHWLNLMMGRSWGCGRRLQWWQKTHCDCRRRRNRPWLVSSLGFNVPSERTAGLSGSGKRPGHGRRLTVTAWPTQSMWNSELDWSCRQAALTQSASELFTK